MTDKKQENKIQKEDYTKIRGWLILPAISLVISCLIYFWNLGSPEIVGWDWLIYAAALAFTIYLTIIFFMKKLLVRKLIYIHYGFGLFIGILYYDVFSIMVNTLWMVYFFKSHRVKKTFVN